MPEGNSGIILRNPPRKLIAPDGSVILDLTGASSTAAPTWGGGASKLQHAQKISAYPLVIGTDVPHDTAAGVGAVANGGGAPSLLTGADASKPATGTAGRVYVASDTQRVYRDSGSAWVLMGVVVWGDVAGKPSLVNTFNGRSGAVSPVGSDYTPAMIGAINKSGDTGIGPLTLSGLFTPNGGIAGALGADGGTGYSGNPVGANLVPNSSFRLGSAFWTLVSGFSVVSDENGGYLHAVLGSGASTINSQTIPVASSVDYVLSADMDSSGTTGTVVTYIHLNWLDASGTSVGSHDLPTGVGASWQRYSVALTSPSTATHVTLQAAVDGATTSSSWRRIKFEPGTVATPYTAEADLWPALYPDILIPGLNADQLQGHTPGTGANQVWLLDSAGDPILNNNAPLQGKESGGTPRTLAYMDTSDIERFGDNSNTRKTIVHGSDVEIQKDLSSIGGQSTSGPLGVPAVVTKEDRVAVTGTTQQTILSFTPGVTGRYIISVSFTLSSTATVTLKATYDNPDIGAKTWPPYNAISLSSDEYSGDISVDCDTTSPIQVLATCSVANVMKVTAVVRRDY